MLNLLAQTPQIVETQRQLEFARWATGDALLTVAVVAAAVIYAILWLYRREGRGQVGTTLRWLMVGCRCGVLLLLGLIALDPVLVDYVHRRLDATTLVLADASASMSLADRYREPADRQRVERLLGRPPDDGVIRAELEEQLLHDQDGRFLAALANRNNVRVMTFANRFQDRRLIPRTPAAEPKPEATDQARGRAPDAASTQLRPQTMDGRTASIRVAPDGAATDLGLAVRSALDTVAGAPVAAVVLLTDGGFNRGEPPAVLAALLEKKGIPLYAVGVGDTARPVNLGIVEVTVPRSVFKNDPFTVTVRLDAQGIEDQPIIVELLERRTDSGGAAAVVETRTIRPRIPRLGRGVAPHYGEGPLDPVIFERKATEPGALAYIARVTPLPDEVVLGDNQRETLPGVQVLDDKMRVLVIAGTPSYDYRALTRMLERDATVDLSTWLQSADIGAVRDGNTIITALPTEQKDLFAYDAIILMDCNPEEFDAAWGLAVSTFVSDRGGGLLYAAGNKYAGRFFRSTAASPILQILPVVPDPDAGIILNDLGHYQTRAWPIILPREAVSEPILRQAARAVGNRAAWSVLEGVYWHYPVRRAKPVAQVLMRHSNPRMANTAGQHVLLATQFVGTGRTAYLAFDSTWRWRRPDEKAFDRFWIQALRYLVEGKLLGSRSRGLITTSKDQYELNDSVVVTVRALDRQFDPLLLPELDVTLAHLSGPAQGREPRTVTLAPVPGREGYYQGRFAPDRVGTWRISLNLPDAAADPKPDGDGNVEKDVIVTQPDIEMRDTAMKREALRRLAEATGGRYFDIDEAGQVAGLIPDCGRTTVTRGRPMPLWDNRYVFALLIAVLTLEWILRKKAKLL